MTKVFGVKAQARDIQLLEASSNRKGAVIYNNSNKVMFIKLGTDASKEDFSTLLHAGSHWEIPAGHTDEVHAVWGDGCSGDAKVSDIQ